MNNKIILNLKIMRLIIAIFIIVSVVIYHFLEPYYILPKQELVLTILVGLFVFFLGLQYKVESKNMTYTYFLMLFAIMMVIVSIIGFLYV